MSDPFYEGVFLIGLAVLGAAFYPDRVIVAILAIILVVVGAILMVSHADEGDDDGKADAPSP